MLKQLTAFAVFFLLLFQPAQLLSFETDQYNLPEQPLADIGDELHEHTFEKIQKAIDKINAEIILLQACVNRLSERASKCRDGDSNARRLKFLRSEVAVARAVYEQLGYGIVAFARVGTWMDTHRFRNQPARFKTSYKRSIFVSIPTDYLTISPTVKIYNTQFGTDKIAHFFQQGFTYYRIHGREIARGTSDQKAIAKAVGWGRMTENTYYGTLVGGVFSNADLYANYAGMRFYQGLTGSVSVGEIKRPATLVITNGIWGINASGISKENFLRPFISDHLNEALNPSLFIPGLRSSIRGIVRKQACPQWRTIFPEKTREDFRSATDSLSLWNGENYGYKKSTKFVTIWNTCFDTEILGG